MQGLAAKQIINRPVSITTFHPLTWNRKQWIIWHLCDRAPRWCTTTVYVHGKEELGKKGGKILAALHGILGPTGAAVPGENPFTGYMLASTVLFIRSKAIKISSTIIFLSRPWIYLKRVLNSTHSALKPLTCRILICFTMVLFPDSPAPSKTDQKHIRK